MKDSTTLRKHGGSALRPSFNHHNTGDFVMPLEQQKIFKAGWGYWDVTTFGYGGDFRRPKQDVVVTVIGEGKTADECKFRLPDGRLGIGKRGALKDQNT
jgi:hypothetical protein